MLTSARRLLLIVKKFDALRATGLTNICDENIVVM